MYDSIKKFEELLRTDTDLQNKLKAEIENYTGEQTEEAVFNTVLSPLAKEYGISATFDEFKTYTDQITDQELTSDEVAQVAGGGPKGYGIEVCAVIGLGIGGTGDSKNGTGNACVGVGVGNGNGQACFSEGVSSS